MGSFPWITTFTYLIRTWISDKRTAVRKSKQGDQWSAVHAWRWNQLGWAAFECCRRAARRLVFFCPDVHWRFDSLALSMIFHLKKWVHQIQYIIIWFGVLQWHPAHCFLLGLHFPASKPTEKVVHVSPLRISFVGLPDAFSSKDVSVFKLEIRSSRRWNSHEGTLLGLQSENSQSTSSSI